MKIEIRKNHLSLSPSPPSNQFHCMQFKITLFPFSFFLSRKLRDEIYFSNGNA